VKWALNDHETFSSRVPAPQWFIFFDPPAHTKLRALISQAFTPRMVANLAGGIREISRRLLDSARRTAIPVAFPTRAASYRP
jgi:cytochrome P450